MDASLKQKTEEAKTQDLTWTNRFGDIAPFLQLDLKLIWRNKRPRMTVFLSLLFSPFLFYSPNIFTFTIRYDACCVVVPRK